MERGTKSANLATATVACGCHVCAFFHSRDDEYEVPLPFLKEGFESGDKAVHIIDQKDGADRLRRLTNGGIHANAGEQNRQIEVRAWENAYLRGRRFDQKAMLALIEEVLTAGKQQGFALTGCGQTWNGR
jgi:hypothetical protein